MTGVLGLILAFVIPWWMRAPIKPAWQLRTQMAILSAGVHGKAVTITNVNGHVADYPQLSIIRFGNRGKGELKAADYDGPVKIDFKNRIVGAAIHDPLEVGTRYELSYKDMELTFKPFLLRKDEWLELQVITDGGQDTPALTARLVGHRADVQELSKERYQFWLLTQIVSAVVGVTMFLMFLTAGSDEGAKAVEVGAIWVLLGVYVAANYRKSKAPRWKNEPREHPWSIFK